MAKATTTAPAAKEVKKVAKTEAKVEAPVKEVKKTEKKKEVTAPAVQAQAVAAPAAEVQEISWNEEVKTMQTTVEGLIASLKGVLANLKRVEKRVAKEIKDARKKKKSQPKENPDGTPVVSQFKKPRPISDELGLFLKKGKGASASRSEVTVAISAYIKEKGLGDKHKIKADAALQKLLGISASDELTYFNLQKYLNKHYIKTA